MHDKRHNGCSSFLFLNLNLDISQTAEVGAQGVAHLDWGGGSDGAREDDVPLFKALAALLSTGPGPTQPPPGPGAPSPRPPRQSRCSSIYLQAHPHVGQVQLPGTLAPLPQLEAGGGGVVHHSVIAAADLEVVEPAVDDSKAGATHSAAFITSGAVT
jgi:hypothetical protein